MSLSTVIIDIIVKKIEMWHPWTYFQVLPLAMPQFLCDFFIFVIFSNDAIDRNYKLMQKNIY